MKNTIFALLFLLLSQQAIAQKIKEQPLRPINEINAANAVVGCSVFNSSQNYICQNSYIIDAPIDNNSGYMEPSGASWGCYGSRPNQIWLLFTVTSAGNLSFTINGLDSQSNQYDIDAIVWGPIPSGNYSNACSVTSNEPISCDWDSGSADLIVNNAQIGQVYVMLITNYSNASNTIYINQPSGGSVSYCMANIPAGCQTANATISGNQTIIQGQSANLSLTFTGTSPWNYTLSNGQSGVANTSPLTLSVSPSQTTTYTISTLRNTCGNGLVNGSATVTVCPSLPTATISGSQTIQVGQSANLTINFTGISPWNYTLSNGQNGTAYTSPQTVIVSPNQTTTYSLSSVSNSCGTGSVSGNATVTVISGSVDLENGLITCFPFSGNASDGRGKNDGTVYGATLTTDRFSRPNQAYSFDGVNDYISFPATNLNNNQFSYSVWVKPDSPPFEHEFIIENTQNIVYTDYSPNKGYGIWNYRSSQTGPATYSQTIPTDLTKWYHIVVTATSNVIKLYIDGNFIATTTVGGTPAYTLATAFIGKRFNDTFYFGGKIDDIRMYNRALNDSEVLALYNMLPDDNCDTYIHTKAGLVSCYSFTNNSYDEIGYNNGTLNNVTLTTDRFGNQNSAYSFTGSTSSNINIPNTSQFLNNSYTYSAWIKASSLPTVGGTAWIVGIGQGGVGDQALYIYNNNGVIGFSAHTYATPAGCLSNGLFSANGGITVNTNQWYHIAVTMGNGAYKMYVDRKLVSSATSSCITMIYGSSPLAYIGSRLGTLSPFNGVIDDVRIYSRALSEEEIININYTKGCRNKCLQTISIDTPHENNFPQRKEALTITASSSVSNASKLRFDGANAVILLPGFRIDNGVVFEAINEGCGGNK